MARDCHERGADAGVFDRLAVRGEDATAQRGAAIDAPEQAVEIAIGDLDRIVMIARAVAAAREANGVGARQDAIERDAAVLTARGVRRAAMSGVGHRDLGARTRRCRIAIADHDLAANLSGRKQADRDPSTWWPSPTSVLPSA